MIKPTDNNKDLTSPATLSEAALRYVGTPFLHRGRTVRGMDCVGLLILSIRDIGHEGYEEVPYGTEPRNGMLELTLAQYLHGPMGRDPKVDDIVLMELRPGMPPSHVGIITEHPNGLGIVHAYGEVTRVVHQRLDRRKRARIKGVFEWLGKF